jgi:hypothetical protein
MELLEDALHNFEHPAPVALTLIRGTYPSVGAYAAVVALKDDPAVLPQVSTALEKEQYPLFLKLHLLQTALAQAAPGEALGPLANEVLVDLLDEGLDQLALDLWRQSPDSLRNTALRVYGEQHQELRLELAMAALEAREGQVSLSFAPSIDEPDWTKLPHTYGGRPDCTGSVLREALLRARDAKRAKRDSYILTRSLQTCYQGPPFPQTFATLLQAKEPEQVGRLLSVAEYRCQDGRERGMPSAVESFAAKAREQLAYARSRRLGELRSLADRRPKATTRDVVARLLDAPLRSPWTERPLPKGVAAAPKGSGRYDGPSNGLTLPKGYWAIRVERKAKDVWVVGVSQNLDPTGEATPGGYWLLHSQNGGEDWDAPIYTGLRALQPYVVTSTSALELVKGDKVTMEVQVHELNLASLTFPPVGLRYKREATGLYVEASLKELRRDSDGDGLTDLVEERMLTDPHSADTDHDGLKDGEDPFPTVPTAKGEPPAKAELLTEVLSQVLHDPHPQANVVGNGKSFLEQVGGRPAPIAKGHVVFIKGKRSDFVGVLSSSHVIVLTEEEVARVSKERGLLYPLELDIVINEAGTEAQINWSLQWEGGSYDAHRENGAWVLVATGSWVT